MNRIQRMRDYIRVSIESRLIKEEVERRAAAGDSTAGGNTEEVFTRDFFCPVIEDFFYKEVRKELDLTDNEIKECLGVEGYKHLPRFGFTPADTKPHLFTKGHVINDEPPEGWLKSGEEKLAGYWACPDFAIKEPLLPVSLVGEVKYLHSHSAEKAVKELYNAARQAIFYLGSFRGRYRAAMVVIAEASESPNSLFDGPESTISPKLLQRFGEDTGIHLLTMKLR